MKRISVVLNIVNNDNLVVKYDLNEYISSFVYSQLEYNYPNLHGSKEIKDFCFSNIIFNGAKYERDGVHLSSSCKYHLLISSSDSNKIRTIKNAININKNRVYRINNIGFKIDSVNNDDKYRITNCANLKAVTPICITDKDGSYVSLIDNEDLFISGLKKNILHKCSLREGDIDIVVDRETITRKRVSYKDSSIIGFRFNFKITCDSNILERSYYGGFGIKNALGFGFVKMNK